MVEIEEVTAEEGDVEVLDEENQDGTKLVSKSDPNRRLFSKSLKRKDGYFLIYI